MTKLLIAVVFLLLASALGDEAFPKCGSGEQPAFPFCMEEGYERLTPPQPNNTVFVGLLFHDFEDISDSDNTVTVQLQITIQWEDGRIRVNDGYNETAPEGEVVDQNMVRIIWIPDFAIYNLKKFDFAHIVKRLAILRIFHNSTIHYSFQARVTIGCTFFFQDYPMDRQECPFLMGSYSSTSQEMIYDGDYFHPLEAQRPLPVQVKLQSLKDEERIVQAKDKKGKVVALYSVTGFKIVTKRGLLGFIFTTYFPSGLAVFVSWISFTIAQDAMAGRLALLVLLTLWQINIFSPLTKQVPPCQYMTAIELYCLVCLVLNAGALLEYGLIICQRSDIEYLSTGTKAMMARLGEDISHSGDGSEDEDDDKRWREKRRRKREREEEASRLKKSLHKSRMCWNKCRKPLTTDYIDNCSIFLFPTIFIVFNIIYWNTYLPSDE